MNEYEKNERQAISTAVMSGVTAAMRNLHAAGVPATFRDLHIHINYASGGGAKVVLGDNIEPMCR